jgi:ATP-dependent protease ClpP protease subunit
MSVRRLLCVFGLLVGSFGVAAAQDVPSPPSNPDKLEIVGRPPKPGLIRFAGTAWWIFLTGTIDADSPKRFKDFLDKNNVPRTSVVYFDSPGGSLFAGMEIGQIIRQYGLYTNVGKPIKPGDTSNIIGAGCASACTLAYVGGRFRYMIKGSLFGVHRFSFTKASPDDVGVAQVAAGAILSHLRSLDVNTELFNLSTKAPSTDILNVEHARLRELEIVNDGFGRTKWTIEGVGGDIYLKGERETSYGVNKLIFSCPPNEPFIYLVFDPQGRQSEVMSLRSHSLVIDDKYYSIAPYEKEIRNGWFNAFYRMTRQIHSRLRNAREIGIIIRASDNSGLFLGFDSMPFAEGHEKFEAVFRRCPLS